MDIRKPNSVLALRYVSQYSEPEPLHLGYIWCGPQVIVKFFIAQLACAAWVFAPQARTQKGQKDECHQILPTPGSSNPLTTTVESGCQPEQGSGLTLEL